MYCIFAWIKTSLKKRLMWHTGSDRPQVLWLLTDKGATPNYWHISRKAKMEVKTLATLEPTQFCSWYPELWIQSERLRKKMGQFQHLLTLRPPSHTNGISMSKPLSHSQPHSSNSQFQFQLQFFRAISVPYPFHKPPLSTHIGFNRRASHFALPRHPSSGFRLFCSYNDSGTLSPRLLSVSVDCSN